VAECGGGGEKQRHSVGVILYWVWRDFVLDSLWLPQSSQRPNAGQCCGGEPNLRCGWCVIDQTLASAAVASRTLGVASCGYNPNTPTVARAPPSPPALHCMLALSSKFRTRARHRKRSTKPASKRKSNWFSENRIDSHFIRFKTDTPQERRGRRRQVSSWRWWTRTPSTAVSAIFRSSPPSSRYAYVVYRL